jgi:murein DD-endopeptidase MepM/ murein hydrolase activator NlpD
MRNPSSAFRARILAQAAAVASLAGVMAGCSADSTRLQEPFFTGSTPNQREIIGNDQPMPGAIPGDATVSSSALPPPGGGTVGSGSATGWSAAGGRVVTVGSGESLDTLAIKYGVPAMEIVRANGISSPAEIKAGRPIVIPVRVAASAPPPAPAEPEIAPTPVVATKSSKGAGVHVVTAGQTLYSISRQYGVHVSDVVALNGLTSDNIRLGQKLKIPAGGSGVPQAVAYAPEPAPKVLGAPPKPLGTLVIKKNPGADPVPVEVAAVPKAPEIPSIPVEPKATTPAATPAAATAGDALADPPSTNGTSFRWPVRGRIISGFGAKPNGERNDGINLAVPEGTSVKAAEAGTVIYSGNELAGYGNLVLVRHADGWVSAYAHNSQIAVKRGDTVKRGQTIGTAGMTGSVTAPQVHFELRKGAKPVNPLDYMSGT